MSRIGRLPVEIPAGVTVTIAQDNLVTVKGPKGQLTQAIHPDMILTQEGNLLHVQRPSETKQHKALHGLSRTLLHNMVEGVTKGYQKGLDIVGVGLPRPGAGQEAGCEHRLFPSRGDGARRGHQL